jgi:hypothetical protein
MTAPRLSAYIQGQGTVSADNLNTFMQTADDTSQLRNLTGVPGISVMLRGVTVPNDGDGGFFYWNAFGTQPDDNFNYITPAGTFVGQWVRLDFPSTSSGTIFPMIIVTGTSNLQSDVSIGGFLTLDTVGGLTATGTTQATAFPIAAQTNAFITVTANSGAILPTLNKSGNPLPIGTSVKVFNRGASNLLVYPPTGGFIETLAANAPATVFPGGVNTYTLFGGGQWYVS